jgi:hypothetical protein
MLLSISATFAFVELKDEKKDVYDRKYNDWGFEFGVGITDDVYNYKEEVSNNNGDSVRMNESGNFSNFGGFLGFYLKNNLFYTDVLIRIHQVDAYSAEYGLAHYTLPAFMVKIGYEIEKDLIPFVSVSYSTLKIENCDDSKGTNLGFGVKYRIIGGLFTSVSYEYSTINAKGHDNFYYLNNKITTNTHSFGLDLGYMF